MAIKRKGWKTVRTTVCEFLKREFRMSDGVGIMEVYDFGDSLKLMVHPPNPGDGEDSDMFNFRGKNRLKYCFAKADHIAAGGWIDTSEDDEDDPKESLVHKVCALLQSAYEADPAAIHALMCTRFPCNETMLNHPSIEVGTAPIPGGTNYSLGPLGLINGLFQVGEEKVAMTWDDSQSGGEDWTFTGFQVVLPTYKNHSYDQTLDDDDPNSSHE